MTEDQIKHDIERLDMALRDLRGKIHLIRTEKAATIEHYNRITMDQRGLVEGGLITYFPRYGRGDPEKYVITGPHSTHANYFLAVKAKKDGKPYKNHRPTAFAFDGEVWKPVS